jgi:predicted double-glycine peptidase
VYERRNRRARRSAGTRRALAPALVCSLLCSSAAASAGSADSHGRKAVRSLQEIRQDGVVRQKWDLSCGSAALSTLLTFDLRDPVTESEIIMYVLRRADPVRIRDRQGFSLLDLKRFVVSRGHVADGYGRLDMPHLLRLAPAIVPTLIGGENHFVVFRGAQEGRVILADPGFGNRTMTVEQFEALWPRRIAFVVRAKEKPAPPPNSELTIVRPSLVREAVGALR